MLLSTHNSALYITGQPIEPDKQPFGSSPNHKTNIKTIPYDVRAKGIIPRNSNLPNYA
jgi:hypothetical protein